MHPPAFFVPKPVAQRNSFLKTGRVEKKIYPGAGFTPKNPPQVFIVIVSVDAISKIVSCAGAD